MPKATPNSQPEHEDSSSPEWEQVGRRRGKDRNKGCDNKDKGRDNKGRDNKDKDRSKGYDKGRHDPTKQPPDESVVDPSQTNSLGGKRSRATDSDSEGPADPKRTPTRVPPRQQTSPQHQTPPHAAATAASGPPRKSSCTS